MWFSFMRIAIVWSHWTGKTTLARILGDSIHLPIIREAARDVIAEMWLPHEMSPKWRGDFQRMVLKEQIYREWLHSSFIADRSVFDAIAYGFDTPYFLNIRSDVHEYIKNHSYDHVLFLPIEFPLELDAIRKEDIEYQKTIEQVLLQELQIAHIHYKIISGTQQERLAQCLSIFDSWLL